MKKLSLVTEKRRKYVKNGPWTSRNVENKRKTLPVCRKIWKIREKLSLDVGSFPKLFENFPKLFENFPKFFESFPTFLKISLNSQKLP